MRHASLIFCLLAGLGAVPGHAQTLYASPAPHDVTLPSAFVTGNPQVDRIWFRCYPAAHGTLRPAPAVIILPPIGSGEGDPLMKRLACSLAGQGMECAVMVLPYHGPRRPPGVLPAAKFTGGDVRTVVQAFRQSASDVGTVAGWLSVQPDVDPLRLGVVGVSLGAIVAHLAMGQDARLKAGVAIMGGGDLADMYHSSLFARVQEFLHPRHFTAQSLAALRAVDPLTYAARNQPRHVLMIEAARDLLIPPHDAEELWRALGEPPIQWIDCNHYALTFTPDPVIRATTAYLRAAWSGDGDAAPSVPSVSAPTLKIGVIAVSGAQITPALQWQALSFARRWDHMSLLHADLGITVRGPFAALGVTATQFVDVGLSPRIHGQAIRPYISLHIVF